MTEQLVAILIPIYKQELQSSELMSLKQCLAILKNHPIIFFAPYSLDTGIYENICSSIVPFNVVRFNDHYFSGIAGYNNLMLSPAFYKRFIKYKYILIYQLDAYVFKDELNYWCKQNYDFIGAPNIPHENGPERMQYLRSYSKFLKIFNRLSGVKHKISNVGNGGFSLRKTKTCYRLLTLLKSRISAWGKNNEDGFFRYWGNILHPVFKLPTDEVALHFAIEHEPATSLRQLDNVLPFGCHAFEKYEPDTWKPYLRQDITLQQNT